MHFYSRAQESTCVLITMSFTLTRVEIKVSRVGQHLTSLISL